MEMKTLPLVITEDHNEVLPHIYRGIGSKALPFSGLTLVHFDSHPDLLIPIDLPAGEVFNPQVLYDTLSIENWIIPAVYAGHISHVVWVKPPWCGQISDKHTQFYVGRCPDSGRIRLSSTENYFVSETLYVPDEKLLDKKLLHLTVVTLQPENWETLPVNGEPVGRDLDSESNTKEKLQSIVDVSPCEHKDALKKLINEKGDNSNCQDTTENGRKSPQDQSGNVLDAGTKSHCCVSDSKVGQNSKQFCSGSEQSKTFKEQEKMNDSVIPLKKRKTSDENFGCDQQSDCEVSWKKTILLKDVVDKLKEDLKGKRFVLDIDLDFFSTMDPFRNMLTEFQHSALRELYKFTPSASTDTQVVLECLKARKQQLHELKDALLCGKTEVLGAKKELMDSLVEDLRKTREGEGTAVDLELIHEAGCTCDDTELPHHVSSDEQIQQLTICLEQLLSNLGRPDMITVARSSLDDYCPPHQVDFIEELVVETLHNVYDGIIVNRDYADYVS